MQNFMRKHQKMLLVLICLFIGVPMLFFGVPMLNDSTGRTNEDVVIATVGGVEIRASELHRALDFAASQRGRAGERPTYQQLDQDGIAGKILEDLIVSALMKVEEGKRDFEVTHAYEDQRLQEYDTFKDSNGNFDREVFNSWVKAQEERGLNWNDLRSDIQQDIAREVHLNAVLAPAARVLDSDIQRDLEDNNTKIRMKYAKLSPPIEPTDEEIQAHYDENQDSYKTPDKKVAEYAAFSLTPPVPEKAADLIAQARAGADFAALADEHSELSTKNGGDMAWLPERPEELDHRKPIFALGVGEVSDPIEGPGGYFIYKVEEERTNEETQAREVHARQIHLKAALAADERSALEAQAQVLATKANEATDLAAAANEAGLTVARTGSFDRGSLEIEGVPRTDARQFALDLDTATPESPFQVITGRSNLYVARVVEVEEGVVQPLEEVRDKVREDTIAAVQATPEYKERVDEYGKKIKEQATNLTQIAELFPELNPEIKESSAFSKQDYLFQDQIYLQTPIIYDAIGRAEPGTMAGPFTDFRGDTYFVELLDRTPPAEEEKETWAEDRKQLREQRLSEAELALFSDYRQDLGERMLREVTLDLDQPTIDAILGRNQPLSTPAEEIPAEGAPAEDAA